MYKHRKGLASLTPRQFLQDYDPIGQYRWEIRAWALSKHDNVLLVRFEALKHDPLGEFQRIFHYLDLHNSVNEASIDESVAQAEHTRRPRRAVYGWKSASAAYKEVIDTVNVALAKEIKELQYEPM
jgi:hypothetical protein